MEQEQVTELLRFLAFQVQVRPQLIILQEE